MRSLFLKIFLLFWLVQVIIGVVFFAVSNVLRPQMGSDQWHFMLGYAIQRNADNAFSAYQGGGAYALNGVLKSAEKQAHVSAYFFDASGKSLGAETPSDAVVNLAKKAASQKAGGTLDSNDLTSKTIRAADGATYVMVWQMPRRIRGPFDFFVIRNTRDAARLLALLLISGLVCYGLAKYLTSPAIKLRSATRQLAEGDLSARVAAKMGRRRDELADLGRDFDQMAERIESLMLSERRLLGDISHELRSPLARMTVALDLMEDNVDEGGAQYLQRIRREAERLNEMIGQLLALSRLESGTAKVQDTVIDLPKLLEGIVADAEFEAGSQDRHVRLIHADDCQTAGAPDLLRSAIENVVRNAVRYTAKETTVEIELKKLPVDNVASKQCQITVRDFGVGVPQESLPHLFHPFYRVTDARDRQSGGTGLGLAISERAIRFHGGNIKATNAPEGGLLVEINLPLLDG
ncbi:MAG: ATP-binding protein [Abditibacteriaceae bacterium]